MQKGKLKAKERILVLTPSALYSGHGVKLFRCIALQQVSELLLAGENTLCLRIPEEHDYFFHMQGDDNEKEVDTFVEVFGQLCKHHRPDGGFSVERLERIDPTTLSLQAPKGRKTPPIAQIEIS
eukprot:gene5448-5382_t